LRTGALSFKGISNKGISYLRGVGGGKGVAKNKMYWITSETARIKGMTQSKKGNERKIGL